MKVLIDQTVIKNLCKRLKSVLILFIYSVTFTTSPQRHHKHLLVPPTCARFYVQLHSSASYTEMPGVRHIRPCIPYTTKLGLVRVFVVSCYSFSLHIYIYISVCKYIYTYTRQFLALNSAYLSQYIVPRPSGASGSLSRLINARSSNSMSRGIS